MRNIKLTIEYDGSNYHGWQIQDMADNGQIQNIKTIQGTISKGINQITGEDPNLICAGRTDAGVHAMAQVASFKTNARLSAEIFKRALNANLPDDIRILLAEDAPDEFHPRYDARGKRYVYIIGVGDAMPVFIRKYLWHVKFALDFKAMKEAGAELVGHHDFSSFRGAGCGAKSTTREITSLHVSETDSIDFMGWPLKGRFIRISIEANAFLRHMVRNIIGTLVDAGRGKTSPVQVREILGKKDRNSAGRTAPAHGLFLDNVRY